MFISRGQQRLRVSMELLKQPLQLTDAAVMIGQ